MAEESGEAKVAAHGILMIIGFLFLSQAAETIAIYASSKTNLRTHYFKAIEHGTKLFNAHRLLNGLAFLVGLVGMIIIFATEEFEEGWGSRERHIIYGIVMMVAVFLQILLRVAYPDDKTKWLHRWFGRAINLWAFFVAFTGYELAGGGSNEGGEGPENEDLTFVAIVFALWYLFKFGIWVFYFAMHKLGKAKEYKAVDVGEGGIQLPAHQMLTTPAS